MTLAAPLIASSVAALLPRSTWLEMLSGQSSHTAGAPGFTVSSVLVTDGIAS